MKALKRPVILECTLLVPDGEQPPSGFGSRQVELTVECGPTANGKHLSDALARRYGTGPFTVAGTPLDALSPGWEPLVTGCVILAQAILSGRGTGDPADVDAHLDLVVLSGPDSGATLPLRRGDHAIGRGGSPFRLTDPSLSRDHAVVSVSSSAIQCTDRGSLHGITLDSAEIRGTSDVSTDAVIRCGASAFAIRPIALWEADLSSLGRPPEPTHEIPAPNQHQGRMATAVLAAGPLLGGVALAWSSGSWQFALLSLLSSAPFLYPAMAGNGAARSFRAQLRQAMTTDRERQEVAFPPLGALLLARAASTSPHATSPTAGLGHHGSAGSDLSNVSSWSGPPPGGAPSSSLWLRLGTGDAEANVECRPDSPIVTRAIRQWNSRAARRPWAVRDAGNRAAVRDRPRAGQGLGRQAGRRAPSSPERREAVRRRWFQALRAPVLWRVPHLRKPFRAHEKGGRQETFTRAFPLVHPDAPLIVRVDPGLVVVAEPSDYVPFVCGLIVQLLRRPDGRRPAIVLVDPGKVLPSSLRFLPGVRWAEDWACLSPDGATATATPDLIAVGAPGMPFPHHFVHHAISTAVTALVHEPPGRGGSALRAPHGFARAKVHRTVGTIAFSHSVPARATRHGTTPGRSLDFIPDFVSPDVLDRFCRSFRSLTGTEDHPGDSRGRRPLADRVPLAALAPTSPSEILDAWRSARGTASFSFPVGATEGGPAVLDLVQDGPHFLVAGTTGAGKSELLRTVVLSAASHLPPSELGFILVDFKGGAAFDGLTGLPHVHGLVTDLGPSELERVLVSLRAEITHREQRFRELGVSEWSGYRSARQAHEPPLPRLCLVIDEFRMMMDHAPDSLRELVRLASIGRSLGVHLILATQRPQGAVSADIRANVGTSIALRVQSELDSVDVIGTPEAARLAADNPGRALVAKGSSRTLIQVADTASVPALGDDEVRVTDWRHPEPVPEGPPGPGSVRKANSPLTAPDASHLAGWCEKISSAWADWSERRTPDPDQSADQQPSAPSAPSRPEDILEPHRGDSGLGMSPTENQRPSPPRRVLAPSLPSSFDPTEYPDLQPGQSDGIPALALVDLPKLQHQTVLGWSRGESVALIGKPQDRSLLAVHLLGGALNGSSRRLISITGNSPSGGTVSGHRPSHPDRTTQVGHDGSDPGPRRNPTTAVPHQVISTRDMARIAQLVRELREEPPELGREHIVHIESWESTLTAIRHSEHYGLEEELMELLRDDGSSGIRCLLGGDDVLAASRALGAVHHTLYLPSARADDDPRLSRALAGLDPSSSRVFIRSSRLGTGLHLAQPASGPPVGTNRTRDAPLTTTGASWWSRA